MERGVANEVAGFVDFANARFAEDDFNRVDFKEVQRIAATCVTGCDIVDPGPINDLPEYKGFSSRLAQCAKKSYERRKASGDRHQASGVGHKVSGVRRQGQK
jgi:hypothetical protein